MYIKVKSSLRSYLVDRTKKCLVECINLMMEATNTKVERLKGVFAWGYRINSKIPEEGGLPTRFY